MWKEESRPVNGRTIRATTVTAPKSSAPTFTFLTPKMKENALRNRSWYLQSPTNLIASEEPKWTRWWTWRTTICPSGTNKTILDIELLQFTFHFIDYHHTGIQYFLCICFTVFARRWSRGRKIAFSLTSTDLRHAEGEAASKKWCWSKIALTAQKLLATILVANNLINIAIVLLFASLSEVIFAEPTTNWTSTF